MAALELPLLVLGYCIGGVVYLAVALWALRAARTGSRVLVALYWSRRSRREATAVVRRLADVQKPPVRRAA